MNIHEAYTKGRTHFMGLEIVVAPRTLVPREETALLGNTALQAIRDLGVTEPRIIDMCCGSGNLACAIAKHVPRAKVWASDIADECVETARRNANLLDLNDRVSVLQGDLFEALRGLALEDTVDVIVCNPPYISAKRLDGELAHLLEFEPRAAFDGGHYGLDIHQRVLKQAMPFLRPGGTLLFEIGVGQGRQIELLFARTKAYHQFHLVTNPAGEARVAVGKRLNTADMQPVSPFPQIA